MVLALVLVALAGCERIREVGREVERAVVELLSEDNVYVRRVRNGTLNAYPDSPIGEAFDKAFSNPSWRHFRADSGESVVEFSGGVMYRDAPVTARLQFILSDTDSSFEVGALMYNDVPQSLLNRIGLLDWVFSEN